MSVLRAELGEIQVETVVRSGLHEYLDGLQTKMNAIGDSLKQDFFALQEERTVNTSSQSQWQKSESTRA